MAKPKDTASAVKKPTSESQATDMASNLAPGRIHAVQTVQTHNHTLDAKGGN